MKLGVLVRTGLALARRPGLWFTALRQLRRLRAPGGLAPAPDYLAFRLVTQYGSAGGRVEPQDVLSYLAWCRQWRPLER